MTDAQLEAAARRFCKLEGIGPDKPSAKHHFFLTNAEGYCLEIRRIYHAILAIEMAMEEDQFEEAKPTKNHEKT